MRIGVYPGSFNPPTIAHLAIAEAAVEQCRLDRIELVISRRTLGKSDDDLMTIDDRLAILGGLTVGRPWLSSRATDEQLVVDIAAGYDVVVVGADKWAQIVDPAWYGGSTGARDVAVDRLPHVAVAPRPPDHLPEPGPEVTILEIDEPFHHVSSTGARAGRSEWLLADGVPPDPPLEDVGE
jgi:hypothetical protein